MGAGARGRRDGSRVPSGLGPVSLIGMLLALAGGGCGLGIAEVEFAPAVPTPGPPAPPKDKQEVGPWFVDRAREYGLDVVTRCGSPDKPSILHALGSGVALFDADGDGDLDLFVAPGSEVKDRTVRGAGGPWLFRNDGPGRWADVTERSGLTWTGWAQGVAVADYDADGDRDLFVAQHGTDTLWQNRGDGTFRDVTESAGLRESYWGVAATWGDADGDGWPDLYVTNYLVVDPINPPPLHDHIGGVKVFPGPGMLSGQPDQLWRNRGDGTFEDITVASGMDRPDGKGMATVFADLDGDGLLDLFVTNDTQANHLFRGSGGGKFLDQAMEAGVAVNGLGNAEGSMGVEVGDLDGDGRLDLVYSNFRHEGTRVCRGVEDGTYQDISNASRVANHSLLFVGWGLILADFDDDGWPDLFQANGHFYPNTPDSNYDQPPLLLANRGQGVFDDATSNWGPRLDALRSGRSVAAGDLDGDGDLDLVMTTMDGPLRVIVNEGERTNHAVNVRLVGRPPNLEALGARVELEAGGRTLVDIVRRGGSFMAASDVALHFGLGGADSIRHLVVHWPDGSTGRYRDLPADALLTIRQDEPDVTATPFLPPDASSRKGRQP